MIGMKVKTVSRFGNVRTRYARKKFDPMVRAGAFVRRSMRTKVGRRKSPRPPGSPVTSPTGIGRRAIVFGVDRRRESVVIGPSYKRVGRSMGAHEHGSKFKGDRFDARPFALPALEETVPALSEFWRGSTI